VSPDRDAPAWLGAHTAPGIRWGLERTRSLLAGAGDPHRRFASVLVGGTNGKGSVCALLEAVLLRACGGALRVGTYTSPHLVSFRERIRVDGRPVGMAELEAAAERLRPAAIAQGATYFEAATVLGFDLFAEQAVDVAVVEVGMGGRLDATNVLDPLVTAVTQVALDHTEILGDTLEDIAGEKAGIFRAGVPALTAERGGEALAALREGAARAGTVLHTLEEMAELEEVRLEATGTSFVLRSRAWGERRLRVPLAGAHQARNAALAAEILARLPDGLRPSGEELDAGFGAASWPGRLQTLDAGGTRCILDVAHNPDGARALAAALEALDPPRPVVLLLSVLADKELEGIVTPLLPLIDAVVATVAPSSPPERRRDLVELERALVRLGARAHSVPELGAAFERARTLAPHGTVLVSGSIHTVGDVLAYLGMSPGAPMLDPAAA
jgi:dihydrofolate synthase / folylpolyglutamate synthase